MDIAGGPSERGVPSFGIGRRGGGVGDGGIVIDPASTAVGSVVGVRTCFPASYTAHGSGNQQQLVVVLATMAYLSYPKPDICSLAGGGLQWLSPESGCD